MFSGLGVEGLLRGLAEGLGGYHRRQVFQHYEKSGRAVMLEERV